MERPLVNNRGQVADALKETGYTVKWGYPAGKITLPRITYDQIANAYRTEATDRLVYQVDCWASTLEEVIDMMEAVNTQMTRLNFRKTYENSDTTTKMDNGLYHKALSYEAIADILNITLIP